MLTAWLPVLRDKLPSHRPRTKRLRPCIPTSIKIHYLNQLLIIPTMQFHRLTLPLRLFVCGRTVLCGHLHDTVRDILFEILGKFGGLSLYGIHLTLCRSLIITRNSVKLL